ncbi:MAG TPA: alpha/beta fold hydrolase [Gemmatimonadaceae bacterium]|nr:alpha/beta fold hydrolase [Gemmatimonadaceae bacterium]
MISRHLVLLHGALGAARQLDPLAEALRTTFRVHQLDFEGHAATPARHRPFRIQHFAENVLELLERDEIESAAFFGYSMGGYVALYLAAERPELVENVATLGTKFRWDPATAGREAGRLDPTTLRAKVPAFADSLSSRHTLEGGWEGVLARTAEFLRDLGDHPPLTDAALARIRQPVRVIVGARDNTVTVDESEDVARRLPHGSFTVLPDTPHPIEQVDVARLSSVLRGVFGAD